MFSFSRKFLKFTLLTSTLLLVGTGVHTAVNKEFVNNQWMQFPLARAQGYDNQQVKRYAQAVLAIEPLRKRIYREIQTIVDSDEIPNVACNRSDSYQDLPRKARSLIRDYCNRSKEIVQEQNLTISEFNSITAEIQSNPKLKQQIQEEMLKLQ
jgi:hypothetical protein